MKRTLLTILIFFFPIYSQAQDSLLTDTLVAYYPFDGNAMDSSGFANDGEVFGATLTSDRFGNDSSAYFFDGIDDYIDTKTSFDFPYRTTSVWFRADSESLQTIEEQNILDQDSHTLEHGVLRVAIEDGKIYMLEGAAPGWRTIFDELEQGEWTNISIVREDSSARYYFNGVKVAESESGFQGSVSEAYENMVFGANRSRNKKLFHGAIDDVRVYNYAASDSLIYEIYTEGGWPLPEDSLIVPEDTLVAYYPFSGNAMDSSGFENDGGVFGATLTEDRFGNVGSAYSFDGIDDYVRVSDSDYLTPNNYEWSISIWFKTDLSGLDRFLFYKGSTTSDREYAGGIALDSTLSFQINGDGDALNRSGVRTPNPSKANVWQHYVGIWDSSSIKIYIDGELQVEDTSSLVIGNFSSDLFLGTYGGGINQYAFKGEIDDMKIYNYALTDSSILDLYTEGGWPLPEDSVIVPEDTLVAYYPFSGNAMDSSGFASNGEVFGATLTSDRFGNENSAYSFDGDLDFIETSSTFDFPNRTISAWFYSNEIDPLDQETKIILVQDSFELENGSFVISNNGNDLIVQDGFGVSRLDYDGLVSNRWYHVVMVRESDSVKYYVDNMLVGKRLADFVGSTFNANKNLIIGASRSKTINFYNGKIDDIRIYNYALTDSAIFELYIEGGWPLPEDSVTVPQDTLVAYYPFSGNAMDSSGFANDGEVFGATLTSDRFGNDSSAYSFDGANYINSLSTFDYLNRSISLWVSPGSVSASNSELQVVFSQDSDELEYGAFKITLEDEKFKYQESLTKIESAQSIIENEWYHLVMIRTGSLVLAYLNGEYLGNGAIEVHASELNANRNLIVGASRLFDRNFVGKIDDIKIYNYALQESEVMELFVVNREVEGEVPDRTTLYQNYPNPFNPSTTIRFDLSKSGYVNLRVYDITGRLVSTIVDQEQLAGSYSYQFNASGLASGVYFYVLNGQDFQEIRKFTLIK